MTTKSSKRVVIINNLNSANIEQAIFILKGSESTEGVSSSLIIEAQRIIDNYIRRIENPGQEYLYKPERQKKRSKKRFPAAKIKKLMIVLLSAAALICAVYLANMLLIPCIAA